MTDVLSPISYGLQPRQEARASVEISTGMGLLMAAWISLGLWAGLFAAAVWLWSLLT